MKNNNLNNSPCNKAPTMNIAHFDAKAILYLWFFSFLFLLGLNLVEFFYLLNKLA